MMAKNIEKVTAKLKEIIDNNGPDYLTDEPYKVYIDLIQSGDTDKKTAGLILYALVNDMKNLVEPGGDPDSLSKIIQEKCSLYKKTADYLSAIFPPYSKENEESWRKKNLKGLSQFLEEDFVCTWKGAAVWDEGNGTVYCYYNAEIVLSPSESAISDQNLSHMLEKNPFMTKDAIHQYFEEELRQYLDVEFEEYCTYEDYYEPTAEDFYINSLLSEWCKKYGFKMISYDDSCGDEGYEPKFRSCWH